jgi:hypothetical protein
MSSAWSDSKHEGIEPLDPTISDFFTFDFLDQLEPLKPTVNAMPDTTLPSDTTFDWSTCIDPSFCLLPNPYDFESSAGSDNTSRQLSADEQSLKETISQLENRVDQLERGIEARLAQIEENIGSMGQRLMKYEEAKEIHDAEYAQPAIPSTLEFC